MHMGVQFLSVPRNWGAEALQDSEATGLMPVFCRGNQSMGIERTLVTFGHYRIEPWQEVWVGLFFFFPHPGKEEWLGVCQQYHSWTKSAPVNHRHIGQRQAYSSCPRLLAALRRQQQLHSHSMAMKKTFGPFAALSPSADLIGPCTCLQGTGTGDFNKAKKLVYYQATEPL